MTHARIGETPVQGVSQLRGMKEKHMHTQGINQLKQALEEQGSTLADLYDNCVIASDREGLTARGALDYTLGEELGDESPITEEMYEAWEHLFYEAIPQFINGL